MGFIDAETRLSSSQAITADAASTNAYDTGAAGNDVSVGEPLCVAFTINVAADHTTGDETYEFQVIQSAASDLGTPDILAKTDTSFLTAAKLVAGYRFYLPIPPGMKTKEWLGAYYNVGGTTPTVTVTADIKPLSMLQNDKTYAKGWTVGT
jgi:hypothetical protein